MGILKCKGKIKKKRRIHDEEEEEGGKILIESEQFKNFKGKK